MEIVEKDGWCGEWKPIGLNQAAIAVFKSADEAAQSLKDQDEIGKHDE